MIEGTEAVLGAIDGWMDLQKEVTVLQDAGRQMLRALSVALVEQASTRAELKRLGAQLTRVDRVQKISLLMNAVFSVAPLAGGAVARAGVAVFEMVRDSIESILDCSVGMESAATPLVVDKFVRQAAQVIGLWAAVPEAPRRSIVAAAGGLRMTWEEFSDIILQANDGLLGEGDEVVGERCLDSVTVEEVEEVEGESSGAGVSESYQRVWRAPYVRTGRNEADGKEARKCNIPRSEERSCGLKAPGAERDGSDAASCRTQRAKLAHSSFKVGGTVLSTTRRLHMRELQSLAGNIDRIRQLNEEQSSCLLAAVMVKFNERRAEHCGLFAGGIFHAFDRGYVDGEALVGTLDADRVLKIARSGLKGEHRYLAIDEDARNVLEDRMRSYLVMMSKGAS